MTKYVSGDAEIDVAPQNEAAFEAAGWSRVEDPKAEKLDLSEKFDK
jgi:hypothetical protein